MGKRMKYTKKDKLKMVKKYKEENIPITQLAKDFQYDIAKIKYLIRLYELHGEWPFEDKEERIFTKEEKLDAIKQYLSGEKSARQISIEIGNTDSTTVLDWIKKYKEGGVEAIQVSRGRKNYRLHADRQKYLAEKELKERLEYLETENAYLKKLASLIQEKNNWSKKK